MKTCLIVFSKNRPLQLDLCLSSIKKNLIDCELDLYVLYDCDDMYTDSYNLLKKEHNTVRFWQQSKSIFKDIQTIIYWWSLSKDTNAYCGFLTDDCIVYKKSNALSNDFLKNVFETIIESGTNKKIVSNLSLRLGLNINKRGMSGEEGFIEEPLLYSNTQNIIQHDSGIIFYDRTQHFHGGYWNYPLSVDGHIYQIEEIFEYVKELAYIEPIKNWKQTPNEFESALQRYVALTAPFQAIYKESCVVNSPNNRVQDTIPNNNGQVFDISASEFLDLFNQGKRIDIEKIQFPSIECCHTEIDILKGIE